MELRLVQNTLSDILLKDEFRHVFDDSQAFDHYISSHGAFFLKEMNLSKVKIYQNLICSTMQEILNDIYPYTKKVLLCTECDWVDIVEKYRRKYPSNHFQLHKSAEKFPEFLEETQDLLVRYPFLAELSWYEWIEVQVMQMYFPCYPENYVDKLPEMVEEFSASSPLLNTASIIRHFQYNIPEIISIWGDNHSVPVSVPLQPVSMVIYKDKLLKVRFFLMNDMTEKLLTLSAQGASYQEIVQTIWESLLPDQASGHPENFITQVLEMLQKLHQEDLILGSVHL